MNITNKLEWKTIKPTDIQEYKKRFKRFHHSKTKKINGKTTIFSSYIDNAGQYCIYIKNDIRDETLIFNKQTNSFALQFGTPSQDIQSLDSEKLNNYLKSFQQAFPSLVSRIRTYIKSILQQQD